MLTSYHVSLHKELHRKKDEVEKRALEAESALMVQAESVKQFVDLTLTRNAKEKGHAAVVAKKKEMQR